jgi:hypothetical protein
MITNILLTITKPATIATSGTVGISGGILYFCGIINPIIGSLTLIIGMATAVIGLIIQIRKWRRDSTKKKEYKKLHHKKSK